MIKIQGVILISIALMLGIMFLQQAESMTVDSKKNATLFLQAKDALQSGDQKKYNSLKPLLVNYPLYPYLLYTELNSQLEKLAYTDINYFLTRYPDMPLSDKLISRWLIALAQQKQWEAFLTFYQKHSDIKKVYANTEIQCHRLQGQLVINSQFPSNQQLKKLWLVGNSQPGACDVLFNEWKRQGGLSDELISTRIWLAFDKEKLRLVNHLKALLPSKNQTWIDFAKKIYKNPKTALYLISKKPGFWKNPYANDIVVMLVKRLSFYNYPTKAAVLLDQADQHLKFSHHEQQMMYRAIGLGFAENTKPVAQQWFSQLESSYINNRVRIWQLRLYLLNQNWQALLKMIDLMPNAYQKLPLWSYWRARALYQLGEKTKAIQLWKTIINDPSYYGLLARNILGLPPLSLTQYKVSSQDLARVAKNKHVIRTKLLWKNNYFQSAKAEWYRGLEKLNNNDKYIAAHLAHKAGWYWTAIKTVIKAKQPNDATIRFPIRYERIIQTQAKAHEIPPSWILGIIRQESAYEMNATSVKGARGLMQLMPATANMLAKQKKIRLKDVSQLWEVDTNILLGTAYLGLLLNQFDDWILASIAYNIGPTRFSAWLKSRDHLPMDVLIENLPWYETRNYIKNVIYFTTMYQQRLGIQSPMLALPSVLHQGEKYSDKKTTNTYVSSGLRSSQL